MSDRSHLPSEQALAEAASALENRASELRAEAEAEEREPPSDRYAVTAPGLRCKADWLDEVAGFLDVMRAGVRP
jgi:hypothetical protein